MSADPIAEATRANTPPAELLDRTLRVEPAPPERMPASADFSPAHYYATAQGGHRLFSAAAENVLNGTNITPILLITNPADSGITAWVWRAAVGASVNGRIRRFRVALTDIQIRAGATPLALTNRGGGSNKSGIRAYAGADVTLAAGVGVTVRSDPAAAYQNIETYVHGSSALRPGAATVYAMQAAAAPPKDAWGSAEYVWWELPVESG